MTLELEKSIVLVGLMGAGKSTVGHRLAEKLHVGFVDVDEEVEKLAGKKVSDIFAGEGEAHFRKLEREVIAREVEKKPPHVIATGGGAFIQEETRKLIREKAMSIWLRAGIDTLVERVSRNEDRPLLHGKDKREALLKLMEERNPIYAEADLIVDSDEGPHYKVIETIIWKL